MLTLKAPTSIYYVPCVTGVFHSRWSNAVAGNFPFFVGVFCIFQLSVRVEDEVKILDRKPTYLCVDEIGTTCPCTWMKSYACTCCYRIGGPSWKEEKCVMHSYRIGLRRFHVSVYFRKDSKVRAQVKMYRAVWKRGRYPERGKHITRILPFIAWAFRVPILECLDVNWGYLVGVTIWLSIELICFLNLFEQTCDVCHFLFHESSDLIWH